MKTKLLDGIMHIIIIFKKNNMIKTRRSFENSHEDVVLIIFFISFFVLFKVNKLQNNQDHVSCIYNTWDP